MHLFADISIFIPDNSGENFLSKYFVSNMVNITVQNFAKTFEKKLFRGKFSTCLIDGVLNIHTQKVFSINII